MKAKVLNAFRDKYTNLLHKENTEIEITQKRYEEINSTSLGIFLEEIKEKKVASKKSTKKK